MEIDRGIPVAQVVPLSRDELNNSQVSLSSPIHFPSNPVMVMRVVVFTLNEVVPLFTENEIHV